MFYLKKAVLFFVPTTCFLCGVKTGGGEILCAGCYNDLPINRDCCTQCGAATSGNRLCGACIRNPPSVDRTITPYRYSYPVDGLIKKFKYDQKIMAATPLIACLLDRIRNEASQLPEALLPVPLHKNRLYRRGYNQAQEICRVISHHLHIPIDNKSAVRSRPTPEQYRLTADQRRSNVRGAFRVQPRILYESVAIVDDVITTAATANELAKTLKRAGAKRVELWALARAGTLF